MKNFDPTQAARCLEKLGRVLANPAHPAAPAPETQTALAAALLATHASDGACEDMLFLQAQLLDALFKRLIFHDIHSPNTDRSGVPYLRDDELIHALRTQNLARMTAESLSRIRKRKSHGQNQGRDCGPIKESPNNQTN